MSDVQAQVNSEQATEVSPCRSGNLLVMPPGSRLPMRCPFCNGEGVEPPVKMTVSNDTTRRRLPVGVGGALGGVIGGAIAGAVAHGIQGGVRFWKMDVYMCAAHREDRKRFILTALLVVGATVLAAVLVGVFISAMAAMLVVGVALIGTAIYASVAQKRFVYKKNEDATLFVKGPCAAFLDSLPEYEGR